MYLETLKVNKNSGTFHFTKYSGKKKKKKKHQIVKIIL